MLSSPTNTIPNKEQTFLDYLSGLNEHRIEQHSVSPLEPLRISLAFADNRAVPTVGLMT